MYYCSSFITHEYKKIKKFNHLRAKNNLLDICELFTDSMCEVDL